MRNAGAAALVVSGGLRQLELVIEEQRSALGQYPSSCPIIYEPPRSPAPDWDALAGCGADAILLPHTEWRERGAEEGCGQLLVPHATSAEELAHALAPAAAPTLVVASGGAGEVARRPKDGGAAAAGDEGGEGAAGGPLWLVELPLGELGDATAASLRAVGCGAVLIDFDVGAWPAEPEALLGRLLSKRSSAFGGASFSRQVGFGTYQSDQYWMNRKIKDAKALIKKNAPPPAD